MWEKNCASASARATTVLHHSSPIPPITLRPPFPLHLRGGGTCVKDIYLFSPREKKAPFLALGPVRYRSVRFGSVRWVRVCPILSGQFYLFAIRTAVSRPATATTMFKYHVGGR